MSDDLIQRLRGVTVNAHTLAICEEAADALAAAQEENEIMERSLHLLATNTDNLRRAVDCHKLAQRTLKEIKAARAKRKRDSDE